MEKSFTVKEILFGLREEYLKLQKELDALDKYLIYNKKIFNLDYSFNYSFLSSKDQRLIELFLTAKRDPNSINSLLSFVQNMKYTGFYDLKKEEDNNFAIYKRYNSGKEILPDQVVIDASLQEGLNEHANKILEYPFSDMVSKKDGRANADLMGLWLYLNEDIDVSKDNMCYLASKDDVKFEFSGEKRKESVLEIYNLLNQRLDRDIFTPDAVDMIRSSESAKKPIDIYCNNSKNNEFFFNIFEDSKKLTLVSRKK